MPTYPDMSALRYRTLQQLALLLPPAELFEFQVKKLREKGLDLTNTDVDRLCQFVPNDPQRFLVVPRRPGTLDLDRLMNLIEINGIRGQSYMDPQHLTDVVTMPRSAHLLLDIEDGRKRLNVKPSVSAENIRREGRIAYTVWYGILHCIVFPYTLQYHSLDLVGSRFKSEIPDLFLSCNMLPFLCDTSRVGNADPLWGAPSAGSIAGA